LAKRVLFFFFFLEKNKAVSRCFLFLKKMDWAVKLNGPISIVKFLGFMWPSQKARRPKKGKTEKRILRGFSTSSKVCVHRSSTDLACESLNQAKAQITNV